HLSGLRSGSGTTRRQKKRGSSRELEPPGISEGKSYCRFLRRLAAPKPKRPRPNSAIVAGSGTADRFRSPVVVPALVRVTSTPIVSEYGLTAALNVPELVAELAAPVSGPMVAKEPPAKLSWVLFCPPQARPVTEPLPPELVWLSDIVNDFVPV